MPVVAGGAIEEDQHAGDGHGIHMPSPSFFPLIAAILMVVHFWRIRKDGGISGPV